MKLSEELKELKKIVWSPDTHQAEVDEQIDICIDKAEALEATQPIHQMAQEVDEKDVPDDEKPIDNDQTVLDLLGQIEEEVCRDYALLNAEKANNLLQTVGSIAEAIELGFDWSENDQGTEYWQEVYEKYMEK